MVCGCVVRAGLLCCYVYTCYEGSRGYCHKDGYADHGVCEDLYLSECRLSYVMVDVRCVTGVYFEACAGSCLPCAT